jgi:hypothetical protein
MVGAMSRAWDSWLLRGIFVVAAVQLCGFVLGIRDLRMLGLASSASPLPFVFSAHDGVETFSPQFSVVFSRPGESLAFQRISIDPSTYAQFTGAYPRRNAYGVIFSHGPVFARTPEGRALIDAVARYGFCADGTVLRDFGLSYRPRSVTLEATPRVQSATPWRYEVVCP